MSGHHFTRRGAADRSTVGRLGGLDREEVERGEKALWLCGGGFRAALFHLGALTRLNELGLLARTGAVGAVDGGSIVAALLATRVPWPLHGAHRDWPEQVAEPLREIARRNVRARSLLRRPLGGGATAGPEERYARELLDELGEEASWGPRLVFGASGLTLSGLAAGLEECLEWELKRAAPGGYDERLVAETIAAVRTDLDAFGEAEQAVLENHGYLLADAALRHGGPTVAPRIEPLPPLPPHPRWMDPERVRAALGSSARRTAVGRLRLRRTRGGDGEPQPRSPELTTLLERHRPLLRYDSLECVRADSAATICSLVLPGRCNSLHRADGAPIATAAASAGARLELSYLGGGNYADGQPAAPGDHLDECGGSLAADALALRRDRTLADVAYGRARRGATGTIWLQYWLFFYFADRGHLGVEQHEGDWQLVQIRLGKGGEPQALTLAREGTPLRLDWEQVETAASGDGPVAVVYPARGSHAPLPLPGTFAAPVVPDHNDGGGPLVRPRLEPIGDDGPGWARWPGRWGATRRREYFEADSPRGPGRRPEWWDPAGLEREARAWSADGDGPPGYAPAAPPAPRLQARREDGLAVVEYWFPEPEPEPEADVAAPVRLIAAAVDAAGDPGPVRALAVEGAAGSFTLQLPPDCEWAAVRAGAASGQGTPGPVATAPLDGSGGERAG